MKEYWFRFEAYTKLVLNILLIILVFTGFYLASNKGISLLLEQKHIAYQINTLESKQNWAKGLAEQNQQLLQKLESLKKTLPDISGESNVLKKIVEVAHNKTLVIQEIIALEEKKAEHFVEHPFEIQVKGSFKEVYAMIYELENMSLVFGVHSVESTKKKIYKEDVVANIYLSAFLPREGSL